VTVATDRDGDLRRPGSRDDRGIGTNGEVDYASQSSGLVS
jgi:hypothetical protein